MSRMTLPCGETSEKPEVNFLPGQWFVRTTVLNRTPLRWRSSADNSLSLTGTHSFRHEWAFRSAATRHWIDRSCVPYLMSAVKSAAAPNGGSARRRPCPGGKSWVLPSLQPVHPLGASHRGPYPVPAAWLWHTMRPGLAVTRARRMLPVWSNQAGCGL